MDIGELAKAHAIIERMSEDVDLKVVLADTHGMSCGGLKNHLSSFKQAVEKQMLGLGFTPDPAGQLARNENRYVANPKATMLQALAMAEDEAQTRDEYQHVLLPLVYGANKPPFVAVFEVFKRSSLALLATL